MPSEQPPGERPPIKAPAGRKDPDCFGLLTGAAQGGRCLVAYPGQGVYDTPDGATWRSGYATVCKTVYTSSILVVASIQSC